MGRYLTIVLLALSATLAGQEGLQTAPPPITYEPPSLAASAVELEQRGDELREHKVYTGAMVYYHEALRRTRDRQLVARLHNKSGIAELQLTHYRQAEKKFKRAIKANRELAEAYNNLGVAYYLQNKYGKAIKQYARALELREDASFHSNLGTAYFMEKQLEPALQEYRRAFAMDPEVFERGSLMGVSARIANTENRAAYEYLLARMYAQNGNLERSLMCLRKAMEEGYRDIKNVYQDAEFAELRKDPRFAELMSRKTEGQPQ